MDFRKLKIEDAEKFSYLIKDMYSHLQNLEWFSPMPFDLENVKSMIENPRFYILGAFDGDILCGVSSFDYKCGKLIGKIDFPTDCDTSKLVEIGFTMVRHDYQGHGLMKNLVKLLLEEAKTEGFEWIFGKVHRDNLASSKSLLNQGFVYFKDLQKEVKRVDFEMLSSQPFFSIVGKKNAKISLEKLKEDDEKLIVPYDILIKKL